MAVARGGPGSSRMLARPSVVCLTGFMACGKSAIGRALASRLGWRFVDLDASIEDRTQRSIQSILTTHGDERFRRLETDTLRGLLLALPPSSAAVIALGGGTFVTPASYALIAARSVSVWLDCPLSLVLDRIRADPRRRLVTAHLDLAALYVQRRPAYARATHRIVVTQDGVQPIVADIVARLHPRALPSDSR